VFPEWQEVDVERDIKVQAKVQMKMIIPKQDKVKRLVLLQLDAQVPEEEDKKSLQKWIQTTLSKLKNQELEMIIIMQPLQSFQMPIIKYQEFLCSPLTALRTTTCCGTDIGGSILWGTREPRFFCDCLTPVWHRDIYLFARQLKEYSN
jgi:hypothetical protein